jgi:hypothetical protein
MIISRAILYNIGKNCSGIIDILYFAMQMYIMWINSQFNSENIFIRRRRRKIMVTLTSYIFLT